MNLSPEELRRVSEEIAEILLRTIDMNASYIVCDEGVSQFVTDRILAGRPCAIVHTAADPLNPKPPRNFGVYRVRGSHEAPLDNSIDTGYVGYLVDKGLGTVKLGCDVTAGDIIAAARSEVLLRAQALMEP
jgi:hypothetical protein